MTKSVNSYLFISISTNIMVYEALLIYTLKEGHGNRARVNILYLLSPNSYCSCF
jgi:hypothetical protein